jgi:hypothetical protein
VKLQFFQIKFADDDEHTSKKNSRENSFGWMDGVRNETHSFVEESKSPILRSLIVYFYYYSTRRLMGSRLIESAAYCNQILLAQQGINSAQNTSVN